MALYPSRISEASDTPIAIFKFAIHDNSKRTTSKGTNREQIVITDHPWRDQEYLWIKQEEIRILISPTPRESSQRGRGWHRVKVQDAPDGRVIVGSTFPLELRSTLYVVARWDDREKAFSLYGHLW